MPGLVLTFGQAAGLIPGRLGPPVGGFDPFTIPDLYAGTSAAVDGYADTEAVATAPLYGTLGGSTVDQGTAGNRFTKVAADPSWSSDGADYLEKVTGVSLAQPFTVVAIGALGSAGAGTFVGLNDASTNRRFGSTVSAWALNCGTALTGGSLDTDLHVLRGYANGASSSLHLDGSSIATGNAGTLPLNQLVFGVGRSSSPSIGNGLPAGSKLREVYVFTGEAAASSWWADFDAYVLGLHSLNA